MKSAVVKRSIIVHGRRTSITLEDAFWRILKDIARSRDMTLTKIISFIDGHRDHSNLSSTIRLFVLEYACAQREVAVPGATVPLLRHDEHELA